MTKTIIALLGMLCLPVPGLAQEATEGAALFELRCSQCHAAVARVLRKLPKEPAARRDALSSLLADHHAPDKTERAALIDWLLAQ